MDLWEANNKAAKIADEERRRLSVRYEIRPSQLGQMHTVFNIAPFPYDWARDHRPRAVRDNPGATTFISERLNCFFSCGISSRLQIGLLSQKN